MKYAITGHTQGIGKCLFEKLSPNIVGFSKSNGYDINSSNDRHKIIDQISDCDIFINSAHSGFGQIYLLIDLVRAWADFENKKIINIGSRAAEVKLPKYRFDLLEYQAEKFSLKSITTMLSMSESVKCKIEYKWFGYVGTERILKKYPHFTQSDYITTDQAIDIILK